MVAQEKINGRTEWRAAPREVALHLAALAEDFLTLVGLQWKLLLVELSASRRALLKIIVLVIAGSAMTSIALLMGVVSAALLISESFGLTTGQGFLVVCAGLVLVAGLLLGIALMIYGRQREPFQRTRTEWAQNVAWLRQALHRIHQHSRTSTQENSGESAEWSRSAARDR